MHFTILKDSGLFRGLSGSEIDKLIESVNYRLRFYHAGSVIALAGEEISALMIVLSGSLRGEMSDLSGRTIKIEDIEPPNALAAAVLFGREARYPVNVIANADSEVLIINKEDYFGMMTADRRILSGYLALVCTKAQFLTARLRFHSFHTIKEKLTYYLLSLPGAPSGRVVLDRTHEELAGLFGVTRPSLSRAIGEMVDEEAIAVDRREIRLINLRRFTGFAGRYAG